MTTPFDVGATVAPAPPLSAGRRVQRQRRPPRLWRTVRPSTGCGRRPAPGRHGASPWQPKVQDHGDDRGAHEPGEEAQAQREHEQHPRPVEGRLEAAALRLAHPGRRRGEQPRRSRPGLVRRVPGDGCGGPAGTDAGPGPVGGLTPPVGGRDDRELTAGRPVVDRGHRLQRLDRARAAPQGRRHEAQPLPPPRRPSPRRTPERPGAAGDRRLPARAAPGRDEDRERRQQGRRARSSAATSVRARPCGPAQERAAPPPADAGERRAHDGREHGRRRPVEPAGADAEEHPGERAGKRQRGEQPHRGPRARGEAAAALACRPPAPRRRRGRGDVRGTRPEHLGESPGAHEHREVASVPRGACRGGSRYRGDPAAARRGPPPGRSASHGARTATPGDRAEASAAEPRSEAGVEADRHHLGEVRHPLTRRPLLPARDAGAAGGPPAVAPAESQHSDSGRASRPDPAHGRARGTRERAGHARHREARQHGAPRQHLRLPRRRARRPRRRGATKASAAGARAAGPPVASHRSATSTRASAAVGRVCGRATPIALDPAHARAHVASTWTTACSARRSWACTAERGIPASAASASMRAGSLLGTVGVQRAHAAVVPGVEGGEELADLRPADLTHDEPVRPHPQRLAHEVDEASRRPVPRRSASAPAAGRRAGAAGRSSRTSSTTTSRWLRAHSARRAARTVVLPAPVPPVTTRET